jgi:hypothetical protein
MVAGDVFVADCPPLAEQRMINALAWMKLWLPVCGGFSTSMRSMWRHVKIAWPKPHSLRTFCMKLDPQLPQTHLLWPQDMQVMRRLKVENGMLDRDWMVSFQGFVVGFNRLLSS